MLFKKYAKDIVALNTKPIIFGIQKHFFSKKKVLTGLKDGEVIENAYNKLALRKGIKSMSEIKMPIVIPSVDITESKEYIFTNQVPKESEDISQYITDISIGKWIQRAEAVMLWLLFIYFDL